MNRHILAEFDDLVYAVLRPKPRGLAIHDIAREVRVQYQQGPLTWHTGTLEMDDIHQSLLRLAIRGMLGRVGTERHSPSVIFRPLALVDEELEFWPKWRPVPILEALAKAAS